MLTQRTLFSFLTACFAVLMFSGCNGSKAFVKRAAKMEEAGMTAQAANLYYTAVIKKPTNVDAMVGLKRTGQIVLAQHISAFDQAVMNHQREGALDAWHEAEAWDQKLEAVEVDLAFPEAKRATYETVKNAHLDESYRKANELLESEQFDEALREFDAILDLDGTYEDAPALRVVAYCEPRYRSGAEAQEAGRFREAYKVFGEVIDEDASYKDASERRQASLEEGRFTIALVEFKNGSSLVNLEVKVQSMVEQRLMDTDDPFFEGGGSREFGPHSAGAEHGHEWVDLWWRRRTWEHFGCQSPAESHHHHGQPQRGTIDLQQANRLRTVQS